MADEHQNENTGTPAPAPAPFNWEQLLEQNNRDIGTYIRTEINRRLTPLRAAFDATRQDAAASAGISAEARTAAMRAIDQLTALERALTEGLSRVSQQSTDQATTVAQEVDSMRTQIAELRREVEESRAARPQILDRLHQALVEGTDMDEPPAAQTPTP